MNTTSKAWVCLVCGYVHRGDTPPEICSVCGAPDTDFELRTLTALAPTTTIRQWRCVICGYEHSGDTPPETCPVCAASADDFEPGAQPSETAAVSQGDARRIVIVGGGIAGVSAAEHARLTMPDAEIILYSKEAELPYYRLNLTRYLAGEVDANALLVHPQGWYDEHRIQINTGVEVRELEQSAAHIVKLRDGSRISYDKLILACGAHPLIPPIPGSDKAGVISVRTRRDADALLEQIGDGVSCICIGGGILGLETAGALARRGAAITLLEGFSHLLPRQLNQKAAHVLESHVTGLGIAVRTDANTREIGGEDKAASVVLNSDETLCADIVTITTGVRANTHLARRAGLQVKSGIVVDAHLRTSDPDIYAVGDAAEWNGCLYGLWEPARYQGAIAGQHATGANIEFGGVPRMNTLKVLGIDLFSVGVVIPEDGCYIEIADETDGIYHRFLFRDNVLVGAILVGDTRVASHIVRAMKERTDLSSVLSKQPAAQDIVAHLLETGIAR